MYEEDAGTFHLDRSIRGITDGTLARLMTFPQVIVSSHQAYFTRTAVGEIADATVRNIDDYVTGQTKQNTLVPRAFQPL